MTKYHQIRLPDFSYSSINQNKYKYKSNKGNYYTMDQFNVYYLTFHMNIFEKNHVFQKRFHVTLQLFLVQILDFQFKNRSRHCGELKHQSNGTN